MSATLIISLMLVILNVKGSFVSTHPKLLVVSYDAFRYDYFHRNFTPYMNELKTTGTHVDYMMNIFVTKTFPNHHSMATGTYAETHGVVDSEFIDTTTQNVTGYSYDLYHYDNKTLPIWSLNEKSGNGRHSGTMMWPGSSFEYNGTVPKFFKVYDEKVAWEDRVDTLISWFTHPINPINFAVLYIEEPDTHGHIYGINALEFNDVLKKLDNITMYLHDKLSENNLTDVNVIHLSDHGMATVTLERIVNLNDYINKTDYKYFGTSPGLHVYPNPGKENIIYDKLKKAAEATKKFKVYRREEIPERYHYKNNPRIGPIFVIAEVGYAFQNLLETVEEYKDKYNLTINDKSEFGLHGYDNEEDSMHPMFFANGPAFLPNCKLPTFKNTDLLPLFCQILQIDCPKVNGTSVPFQSCLKDSLNSSRIVPTDQEIPSKSEYKIYVISFIVTITGLIIVAISIIYLRKRVHSKWSVMA